MLHHGPSPALGGTARRADSLGGCAHCVEVFVRFVSITTPLGKRGRCLWMGALGLGLWGGGALAGVPSKKPPPEEHGETLWLENCWHCHGKRALGDGPLAEAGPVPAPPLAGRVPSEREAWTTAIHRGKGTMPAFAPVFDRAATRDILTWLDALDPETGDGPSLAEAEAKKKAEAEEERRKRAEKREKAQQEAVEAKARAEAVEPAEPSEPANGADPNSEGGEGGANGEADPPSVPPVP